MIASHPWAAPAAPAAGTKGEQAYQWALTGSLWLLGVFLPFSVAGTALSLLALLILALLAPVRLWRLSPWRNPLIATGLLLFAWIALRIIVEPVSVGLRAGAINRYHELLMLPLLWCLLRVAHRPDAMWHGLLVGTFVYAAAHWVVPWVAPLAAFLESRRISGGLVFPVVAFLLFEYARAHPVRRSWLLGGALFLVATAVFFSDGRTGHVLALLMMGCAAWRAAPKRYRWMAALAVVVAATCVALLSSSVRSRITETLEAAQADRVGTVAATSTGYRLQVWRHGAAVARDNALLGAGWANYRSFYEASAVRPDRDEHWMHSDNPHNEYLLQLGGGGIAALLLFLAWLAIPLRAAWRQRGSAQPWPSLLACLTLAFAAGCMANSLLLDFAGGHFHVAVLAWLLARQES